MVHRFFVVHRQRYARLGPNCPEARPATDSAKYLCVRAPRQGRSSVRTRGPDGRVDIREQLHNLDPGSASQFDAEWLGHAERGLSVRSGGGGGGTGGGRRIPIRGADDSPPEQPQHTRIEEVVRSSSETPTPRPGLVSLLPWVLTCKRWCMECPNLDQVQQQAIEGLFIKPLTLISWSRRLHVMERPAVSRNHKGR